MNLIKKLAVFAMVMTCFAMLTVTAYASEGESIWDQIVDTASDVKDTVIEKAPGVIEDVKETGADLLDRAKGKAPEVLAAAKDGLEDAQETASDLYQQQEDYFWNWFGNQIHPTQAQDETPEAPSEGTDGSTSNGDDLTAPAIAYYDPNLASGGTTAESNSSDDNPAASSETTPAEASASDPATVPEGDSDPEPAAQTPDPAANDPETDAQTTPERASTSLSEKIDGWLSVFIKIAIITVILVLGGAGYHKIMST